VEDYHTAKHLLASEEWSGRYPNQPLYLDLTLDKNVGKLEIGRCKGVLTETVRTSNQSEPVHLTLLY
jgi:hypothetical protein